MNSIFSVAVLPVVIMAIVFGPILAVVAVIAVIRVAIRAGRGANGLYGAEDTKLIQEIYRGLQKMEQRVESLETILLEKEKKQV